MLFRSSLPEGGVRTEAPLLARGTVRVEGALWPYVRSEAMLLAAPRIPLAQTPGCRFEDPPARATVAALLTAAAGPSVLDADGHFLRDLAGFLARSFGPVHAGAVAPLPVGLGPDVVFDAHALPFVLPFLGPNEKFTLAPVGEEILRLVAPRVRMLVPRLDIEPVLVFGGEVPAEGVTLDMDRLRADRNYALGLARAAAPRLDANLDAATLRSESPGVAMRAAATFADAADATQDALFLRELAHACELHGFTWAELDVNRPRA